MVFSFFILKTNAIGDLQVEYKEQIQDSDNNLIIMNIKKFPKLICDGNEAVAIIAHKTNEVCAIYPITPSSADGEPCRIV